MRIAVASVSGLATGVELPCPAVHKFVERRGALGLHHGQTWQAIDEPGFLGLAQAFPKCRNIAEIAAGQHHPIRHAPIALVEQFEHDALLAFDAERIHGIEQIDAEPFREHAHQRQDLIEVRFHLQRVRSVFERLRELPERNISVRQKDQGFDARPLPRKPPSMPKCCRWKRMPRGAYPNGAPAKLRRSSRCP